MTSRIVRAGVLGVLGGIVATTALVASYAGAPNLVIDMGSELPPLLTGFYPPERDASGLTFAWTRDRAELVLPGLDRRLAWDLSIRLRGARPDPSTLPTVTVTVDGIVSATAVSTNEFMPLDLTLPPLQGDRRGATVALTVSDTFMPSPEDPRALGVVVDEITLTSMGIALAPRRALLATAVAGAALAGSFALVGLSGGGVAGATLLVVGGQSTTLRLGLAPYTRYPDQVVWVALAVALGMLLSVLVGERVRQRPLRNTARFVVALSGGMVYLKLLVLLHPGMPIGDAMFHAHRFMNVLGGNLYFTSVAPGQYEFPYSVALYVLASPLSVFFDGPREYVTLLRMFVTSADALAGALLYVVVVRAWGDRLAGAAAVVLYHLVPLDFRVLAIGNLTNAFGQSAAVAALAAVTAGAPRRDTVYRMIGVSAIVTLAFLSHTSTFAILLTALMAVAGSYHVFGGTVLRSASQAVWVVTGLATVVSVVGYYAHFGEVYWSQLTRIASEVATTGAGPVDAGGRTIAERVTAVPLYLRAYFGWPPLLLAVAGTWRLVRSGTRDRLGLALAGWGLSCVLFLIVGLLTPVDMRYYLAAIPAIAVVAGLASSQGWRAGGTPRLLIVGLLAWTAWVGIREWIGWITP